MKEIEFKGKAMEYFGIWLANILLTVVTIGIFSAWAKVRRLKYFYNNTNILENSFAYHATGWQIFKGRIIAFVVIIILGIGSSYIPGFSFVSFIIIFFLSPFIINSSLRFNARMISYRNIRFNWHGNYKQTLLYFVLGPVISFFSLGFLQPLFTKFYYTYYANNHSYGTSRFSADTTIKQYYINNKSNVFIKWPNYILINDAKCAGILIENLNSETSQEFIAIGIGVNITTHPANSMFRATSLKREFDFEIDRDEFLDNLTYNLLSKIRNWDNGNNILNILKIWKKYAYKLNKKISMLLSSGDRVNGIFQDLDSQGGLILISEGKKRVFYAAEIIEEIKID